MNKGRRTAVIHGLGGIGKTQLAIAYCKRHRAHYSTALWLNARDESSLKQSFDRLAERILHHDQSMTYIARARESRDTDMIVAAVKRWLDDSANDSWLLVCDNYDRPTANTIPHRRGQTSLTNEHHPDAEDVGHQDQTSVKAFDLGLYLPHTDHGAVIITSRSPVNMGPPIKVGKLLAIDDSLKILALTSGRDGIKLGK